MDSFNLRPQPGRTWGMGISTWRTLSRFHRATLDRSTLDWIFDWTGSLRLDISAWLGCFSFTGCLCREFSAKACAFVYITNTLGGIILRLCMASHLVRCLRDGNTLAWTHCSCRAG